MRTLAFLVFGFFLTSAAVWGQTSQINGVVKDSSGLAIPGAAIKATQTATGVVRTTTSGGDGSYTLPNLPIGPYLLEVTKDGFNKYAQTGIVLQVDTNPTIDVGLQIGAVSTQVTVEAGAAQVETRSTAIGQVVDNQRIAEMPLNGRDAHELIFLAGMANYPGAGSMNTVRNYPTVVVSVAGGNGDGVAYLLDGIMHQDPYNSLSMPLPFPDALQEFKVETSAVPAQYGFHATASVNIVTKSGTNDFHGDVFEFLRNGDLNARDFFATKRDTIKRNQYGGVIGGPVKKDKLFFFAGYQRTSLRSDGVQNTAFIPTAQMVAGDFTAAASPACASGKQVTLNAPFVNNQISPSLLSPVILNIVKTLPVTTDPCGRVLYGLVANQDEDLVTAKMDYQISDKHSFFGRYLSGNLTQSSTYDGHDPLSINQYGFHDLEFGFAFGDTYLLGPNLVNSLHFGANRTNISKLPDVYKSWADLGANVTEQAGKIITFTGTGAFSIGSGGASPGQQHNGPLWSVFDDISWVKGSHQFVFGGSIFQQRLNYWSGVNAVGTAVFNGNVTGLLLGDIMLGRPFTFAQGTNYGFYTRQYYEALYAQDTWKATPRLTVNYGVRWEPYLAPYNNRGENEHFDPTLFAQNVHSKVFNNSPAGLFFPGDPQYTSGDYINGPKWAKFFPRVGVAWDPQGNGRMTIRAGWGMYGDRAMMLAGTAAYFAPPFGNNISLSGVSLTDPWAAQAGGNPMPTLSRLQGIGVYDHNIPFAPGGAYVNSPMSDFNPVYMNQWNLSLQRQVGKDWLLSANYIGNNTIHMVSGEQTNPSLFLGLGPCTLPTATGSTSYPVCSTTANAQARRLYSLINPPQGQYYGLIGNIDDGGTASYEGMYLSAQKRLSRGFTVQGNYTWSHCISDQYNQNPGNGGVAPYNNRRQWRSNCTGIDLRHQFQMSVVATTPKFSNRWLRLVGSDWQFAPILQLKSSAFFTVFSGSDQALSTVSNQTPNLVDTNPYPSNQSVDNWINRSAFAVAAPGSYGNLGYNNLKGPGVFQLNLALSRNFTVREKMALQVRAEAFNLPNHLNPFAPGVAPNAGQTGANVSLTAPNFSQITNDISGNGGLQSGDYRVIQLAMKFVF